MRVHAKPMSIAAILLLAAACTLESAAPRDRDVEGEASATLPGGLVQHVRLDPAEPTGGLNVALRSVIVNEGTAAVPLTSRICGLDYAGALALTHPPEVMKCDGVSQSASLAPGDSVQVTDLMRVASVPGTYELRVRHAIDPERWVSVEVVVRAP
jgi:hypothetical protein